MASLRRLSDGATPLRQQRQITSFFSPGKPSNQASANSPASNSLFPSKRNSNSSPSPQSNQKPRLTIGPLPVLDSNLDPDAGNSPVPRKSLYGEEVVGKKIRVFWPLDDDWYEGCVKSFDKVTGKHLILYEDAEEEDLDLGIEKFEWIECFPRSFRRLRRNSDCSARNGAVTSSEVRLTESVKAGDVSECALEKESSDVKSGDNDDSTDEDWGKSMGKEMIDDDSEDVALESDGELENLNEGFSKNCGRGKRKKCEGKMSGSANAGKRKSRIAENGGMGALGVSPSGGRSGGIEPSNGAERVLEPCAVETFLTGDAPERFGRRETEKFGFLGKGRKDADGRSPGDVNYNARTLYLPPSFLKSLTGGQRQWWEFKSKHMDKVLFFKMGKFYELFEMDAHVGAKELDLQYMKGEQPHCGFPEKNFSMNVEKLARKGYRVLVVEQTETPEQLELRRKEMGSKDKVVKREICAVVTKGTLTEGEMLATSPDSTYLMSVTEGFQVSGSKEDNDVIVGICVVDVSTSRFMLGQFRDDPERHQLCSILAELRPVELIKPAKKLNPETEKVLLRHTRNPLVNELIPFLEFWDAERTLFEIRNLYGHFKDQPLSRSLNDSKNVSISASPDIIGNVSGSLPDVLSTLASSGENGQYALSALGGCLFYLRQTFLDEALLRFAKFDLLPSLGYLNTPEKPYMTLDAAALENLEIFENNKNGGTSGTLFAQLDHCVTAFGKRLLKNWLARPLYHVASIIERQDAVADLKGVASASALEFRKELSRLPDMERLLSRLFAGSEANGRNANKVVLYEDAAKKQLQEFIAALRGCQQMEQACSTFSAILNITESSLLHHILTPGKGLPDIHLVLKHFKDGFDWSEADRTGRVIPCGGVDVEYDSACRTYVEIETSLATHLKEQRKVLGDASINYVTVGKEQYLLEVPENLQGTVPGDYELRSSRKGYFRYWTPKIKLFLQQLSQAEAEKESKLKSIQQRLIGSFCVHHVKWRQLVSATAELDVLISLAATSNYHEGPTCRPAISGISSSNEGANSPCLSAKCLGHPILRSDALGKGSFVPNDVDIGGVGRPCFILLTGPNMGGKSTLLRQICMAVILAQIGADVPAESFLLSPVDRIFVRMGARDHIMAGQSTFLTELSETGAMLSSATHNSLVVLDELGRGTSTSDGQAIAESVLEHFIRKIRCRGMFSTHYHRLAVNYENDPMVSLCHMACQVGQGARDVEEVTFLYRLTPGICPKSYGVNVARLAGIPDPVLRRAAAKSTQFESIYGKHMHGMDVDSSDNCADEEIAAIQEILSIGLSSNCHEISKNMDMSQLCKLQERASLLM